MNNRHFSRGQPPNELAAADQLLDFSMVEMVMTPPSHRNSPFLQRPDASSHINGNIKIIGNGQNLRTLDAINDHDP